MLNPTQIGLAVGVVSVCCLMAFGGGVIAGMWYKASDQNPSYSALATSSGDAATPEPVIEEPLPDPRVTFYDTLKGKTPYAPLTPSTGSVGTTKTPTAPPAFAPSVTPAKTSVASASPGHGIDAPKTALPGVPSGSGSVPRAAVASSSSPSGITEPNPDTVAATPPPVSTKAAPALPAGTPSAPAKAAVAAVTTKATTAPAKATVTTASGKARTTKAAAAPAGTDVAATTPKETSAKTLKDTPAPAATPAARAGDKQYSVQAGSFRSPEQAERLRSQLVQKGYQARVQLFTTPNNESWYRVRVGTFSDRTVAGQTAQTLASREQLQTVVANDPR